MSTVTDFEYLNLAEVNPEIEEVPEGDYTFSVVGAERKSFIYKQDLPDKGVVKGASADYLKFSFAIINDPENGGRRIYQALFPDKRTPRFLRLIQDATGVIQNGTLDDWLKELVETRASFNAPVKQKVDKRNNKLKSEVNLGFVQPAN